MASQTLGSLHCSGAQTAQLALGRLCVTSEPTPSPVGSDLPWTDQVGRRAKGMTVDPVGMLIPTALDSLAAVLHLLSP